LIPFVHDGLKLIGVEPSCILTLLDEYLDFYPHDSRAKDLANASYLIEEFLTKKDDNGERPIDKLSLLKSDTPIYFHNHCHTKALSSSKPMIELLQSISPDVFETGDSCCGMAGAFGYEVEHYEFSKQVNELKLFPTLREIDNPEAIITAAGTSCRTQIQDGINMTINHLIDLIAKSIGSKTKIIN